MGVDATSQQPIQQPQAQEQAVQAAAQAAVNEIQNTTEQQQDNTSIFNIDSNSDSNVDATEAQDFMNKHQDNWSKELSQEELNGMNSDELAQYYYYQALSEIDAQEAGSFTDNELTQAQAVYTEMLSAGQLVRDLGQDVISQFEGNQLNDVLDTYNAIEDESLKEKLVESLKDGKSLDEFKSEFLTEDGAEEQTAITENTIGFNGKLYTRATGERAGNVYKNKDGRNFVTAQSSIGVFSTPDQVIEQIYGITSESPEEYEAVFQALKEANGLDGANGSTALKGMVYLPSPDECNTKLADIKAKAAEEAEKLKTVEGTTQRFNDAKQEYKGMLLDTVGEGVTQDQLDAAKEALQKAAEADLANREANGATAGDPVYNEDDTKATVEYSDGTVVTYNVEPNTRELTSMIPESYVPGKTDIYSTENAEESESADEAEKTEAQKSYDGALKTYQDALSSSAGLPSEYLVSLKANVQKAAEAVTDEAEAAFKSANAAYWNAQDVVSDLSSFTDEIRATAKAYTNAVQNEVSLKTPQEGKELPENAEHGDSRTVEYTDGSKAEFTYYDGLGWIVKPDTYERGKTETNTGETDEVTEVPTSETLAATEETKAEEAASTEDTEKTSTAEETEDQENKSELQQQAYVADTQQAKLDATKQQMLEYFDSLGTVDEIYDSIKDFFGTGITREDVEQYCSNEETKQNFLSSIVQNGGEITLDKQSADDLKSTMQYAMENMDSTDLIQYAQKMLNLSDSELSETFKEIFADTSGVETGITKDNFDEKCSIEKNDEGQFVIKSKTGEFADVVMDEYLKGSEELLQDKLTESINKTITEGKTLSFNDAFQMVTGVEYNADLITDVMSAQDDYMQAVETQQYTSIAEELLANISTPAEALEYFEVMAQHMEGTTAEELFNDYYAQMFEQFPDEMQVTDNNGLTCKGISVQDGYLWQEVKIPEGSEWLAQSEFLYTQEDEEGNTKYYKVVSLEDEHKILSNLSGENKEYDQYFFANKNDDPTYNNNPLALFYKANDAVSNNNLYTKKECGSILEEYPKMYEEAFGNNVLADKLAEYTKDMDSYASKLSMAATLALTAACFVPGVNVAEGLFIGAGMLDNAIDGANIATNNKDGEFSQWLKETAIEAAIYMATFAIAKSMKSSKSASGVVNDGDDVARAALPEGEAAPALPSRASTGAEGTAKQVIHDKAGNVIYDASEYGDDLVRMTDDYLDDAGRQLTSGTEAKFGNFDSFDEYARYCDEHGYARYASREAYESAMSGYAKQETENVAAEAARMKNANNPDLNINNRMAKEPQFKTYEEYAKYADEQGWARYVTEDEAKRAEQFVINANKGADIGDEAAKNAAKAERYAQRYNNGKMSQSDWKSLCDDEYCRLRGTGKYAKNYGNNNFNTPVSQLQDDVLKSKTNIEFIRENGWNYRFAEDQFISGNEIIDRMSLNVKGDSALIEELDTLMTNGTYVNSAGQTISIGDSGQFYYKTYDTVSKWGLREDPITIYCRGEASAELEQAIAEISGKYARGYLCGAENSATPWMVKEFSPSEDMINTLIQTANEYDNNLAWHIYNAATRNGERSAMLSSGQFRAFWSVLGDFVQCAA